MRPAFTSTVRRVPSFTVVRATRQCVAFKGGRTTTASTSDVRGMTTTPIHREAIRPSSSQRQVEYRTGKQDHSSIRDTLPPTLARPPRRRSGNHAASMEGEDDKGAQSTHRPGVGQKESSVASTTQSSEGIAQRAAVGASEAKVDNGARKTVSETTTATSISTTTNEAASPPRKTISERIRGLWENVKYLFRFYYNGVKQIWRNRALVAEMRKQIADRQQAGQGDIRWREKAAIELHESDIRKLPLFLAILIILEEILPLVVIYAPSLLPSTCILPSQSLKMRAEEERRRGMAVQRLAGDVNVRALVERVVDQSCGSEVTSGTSSKSGETLTDVSASSSSSPPPPSQLSQLSASVVRDVATVFGLRTWGPLSFVVSRIDAHLRFLQRDDELLQHAWDDRAKNVDSTTTTVTTSEWQKICQSSWLWRASGRRGLRSSAADEGAMERNLEAYLHLSNQCTTTVEETNRALYRALIPLALYDGTLRQLDRLQSAASREQSKGLRARTKEVVESVVQEEKRKEGKEA